MTSSLSRRGILGAIICAPAIVRASSLMPIKVDKPFDWFRDKLPFGVSRVPPGQYEYVIIDSYLEFGDLVMVSAIKDIKTRESVGSMRTMTTFKR